MRKLLHIISVFLFAVSSSAYAQDANKFSIGAAFISSGSVYSGVSSSSRFSPSRCQTAAPPSENSEDSVLPADTRIKVLWKNCTCVFLEIQDKSLDQPVIS